MAPRTTVTAALLRKVSQRRDSKGSAEPAGPVHLDSADSVSDELAAVLLDDGSLPIGMTTEDAAVLKRMRAASAEQVVASAEQVAPPQRGGSAREALRAAETGVSPRVLRQQRSAILAAAEAPAVPAAVEGAGGCRARRKGGRGAGRHGVSCGE